MAIVYILYSESINKFYVGASTLSIDERLHHHNTKYYENKYTAAGIPWAVFWILQVEHMTLAVKIENHIKRMKSRAYIQNLKKYPEMQQKLIDKYADS